MLFLKPKGQVPRACSLLLLSRYRFLERGQRTPYKIMYYSVHLILGGLYLRACQRAMETFVRRNRHWQAKTSGMRKGRWRYNSKRAFSFQRQRGCKLSAILCQWTGCKSRGRGHGKSLAQVVRHSHRTWGKTVLSNPLKNRKIGETRIKKDPIYSRVSYNLLRGRFLAESYVPTKRE